MADTIQGHTTDSDMVQKQISSVEPELAVFGKGEGAMAQLLAAGATEGPTLGRP
jgi:hypothetical protein